VLSAMTIAAIAAIAAIFFIPGFPCFETLQPPSRTNARELIGLRFACTFYGIFAFTTFFCAGLPRIDGDRSE
jgi:hypothetical protein